MNRNRKTKNRKKETAAAVSLLLASSLILGGCGTTATSSSSASTESTSTESSSEASTSSASTSADDAAAGTNANPMASASTADIDFDLELTESMMDTDFTDREQSGTYKKSEVVTITLNKTTATVSGNGATVDGSTITITEAGVYLVSGTIEDGQIIVDASDSDKVQIVLDGADIHCETSAAIYVREADKVFLTLAENSENTLSSGTEYTQIDDNTVDGVIFSKSDIACNGSGSLTIEANYKHGIVSKDDLVITGGTYKITAADNGITAKDQLKILDGTFDIDAANSAVKAKNTDDTELGNIYIAGGTFNIKAEQDGFHATGSIVVDDGTITVNSGDDGFHADLDTVINGGTINVEESYEGLEGKRVVINGGDITVNSSDDGINAASSSSDSSTSNMPDAKEPPQMPTQNNDSTQSDTADSAADSDTTDTSSDTEQNDTSARPELPDGADSDQQPPQDFEPDNAPSDASGNAPQMMQGGGPGGGGDSELYIKITGGILTVSADGDGLDSNGSLLVTGGTTIVYGPNSDGDGALDYDGGATVTGGTLAAIGSAGMTQGFGEDSTQPSITYYCTETQSADTTITLTDRDGTALFTVTPGKAYASIVLTFPELTMDETYTLTVGTDTEEITLTDTLTTAGTQPTKTMDGTPGGGNMPANGDNKGTPPSKPDDVNTTDENSNTSDDSASESSTTEA